MQPDRPPGGPLPEHLTLFDGPDGRLQVELRSRIAMVRLAGAYPTGPDLVEALDPLFHRLAQSECDVVLLRAEPGAKLHTPDRADLFELVAHAMRGVGIRLWITVPSGWAAYQRSLQLDERSEISPLRHVTCPDLDVAMSLIQHWLVDHPPLRDGVAVGPIRPTVVLVDPPKQPGVR